MNLNIDYERAEALAICGRLIEEVYSDEATLNRHGDSDEVFRHLARLVEHFHVAVKVIAIDPMAEPKP